MSSITASPEINAHVGRHPGVPLRVFIKLRLAPVTAEVIFLVFISTGEFCIIFINDHKTDGVGCHGYHLVPVLGSVLFS